MASTFHRCPNKVPVPGIRQYLKGSAVITLLLKEQGCAVSDIFWCVGALIAKG
ncbi:hypothetical protein [Arthrobacter sp. QXT-31]|uniref:hypothetical protein n=1 Tax=Arthrobacter sp. QXT-31 TaxID=1357915 RepID=UPI0015615CCD|nr:hypothetical protein [Arthrobacter sp. QXT-31]